MYPIFWATPIVKLFPKKIKSSLAKRYYFFRFSKYYEVHLRDTILHNYCAFNKKYVIAHSRQKESTSSIDNGLYIHIEQHKSMQVLVRFVISFDTSSLCASR